MTLVAGITVYGRRYRWTKDGTMGPNPVPLPPRNEGTQNGGDHPEECQSTEGMSQEDKWDAMLDYIASLIRGEILSQPNQAMEYGALIFVNSQGQLRSTRLINSPDYRTALNISDLPTNQHGHPDYSTVVGIIHSHPRWLPRSDGTLEDYYSPSDPTRLLRPSNAHFRNGAVQGDWITTSQIIQNITSQGGNASNFRIYVAGFDGTTLGLNRYTSADYETTSASGYVPLEIMQPCSDA